MVIGFLHPALTIFASQIILWKIHQMGSTFVGLNEEVQVKILDESYLSLNHWRKIPQRKVLPNRYPFQYFFPRGLPWESGIALERYTDSDLLKTMAPVFLIVLTAVITGNILHVKMECSQLTDVIAKQLLLETGQSQFKTATSPNVSFPSGLSHPKPWSFT